MTDIQKRVVTIALSFIFTLMIAFAIFCTVKIYSQESKINSKADTTRVNRTRAQFDTIIKYQNKTNELLLKLVK
jgi:hypothetical protein